MTFSGESNDGRVAEEAAEWFGRIREDELSKADRTRFAQWLAESPVHVREYLGVSQTWGALQGAAEWPEETSEELLDVVRAAQPTNVTALATRKASPAFIRSRFSYAAAASFALVAVLAFWLWLDPPGDGYRTARGEQRSVVLPDGSIVQLNTLTRMNVHFDEGRRRIELPQGEAFFRVAREATRPFDVETPYAVVRAVGTEFNVYNRARGTRIAVVEGKVRVELSPGNSTEAVALGPKELLDVNAQGRVATTASTNALAATENATAWMQRRIVLDNDRIDEAVGEFNRYNKVQMRLDDAALAGLRISGVFSADDPRALMKYLEQIQGVDVRESAEGFVLQRR